MASGAAQPARVRTKPLGRLVRRGYKQLNQPLPVALLSGLMLLGLSNYVQNRYWERQQQFLARQDRLNKRHDIAYGVLQQILRDTGKVMSASADVIGAHENRFSIDEIEKTNERYNVLQNEWDQSIPSNEANMRLYFTDRISSWKQELAVLDELDKKVGQLQTFKSDSSSEPHIRAIVDARRALDRAQLQTLFLALSMHQSLPALSD